MEQTSLRHKSSNAFVVVNTQQCKACWQCINTCSRNAISRINLPWHKHVVFSKNNNCSGCLACIKVCPVNALVKRNEKE